MTRLQRFELRLMLFVVQVACLVLEVTTHDGRWAIGAIGLAIPILLLI